ncbi:MAG: phosphoenolpyruvate carboxykinase (ATP), partial [Candidatus Heimdallarchaeota archaeon]|nr:phosphoenolpyruvate carboxykinase (ATP) [Candidatus Heimdallarchaeota archaeon]
MTKLKENLDTVLSNHKKKILNPERKKLIQDAIDNHEAIKSANGALATWTPPESTGRSPKDTVIVRRPVSEGNIDWTSPNCLSITEETFNMAWEDALKFLSGKEKLYISDRSLGADPSYTMKVRVVSDRALHVLFTYNMFREPPKDTEKKSFFAGDSFTILVLPYNKLDRKRYEGKLRKLPNGETSNMIVAMDFDRGLGVVIGSAYCGSIKKLMFTVMNYMLPEIGILPLHCSANEGPKGATALLLGLSGTGKTTLSADPSRALLGDDEHGWSENGIANFENGCYAKLINLRQDKEPEIYDAMLHDDDYLSHGAIFENTMMYPNGVFDLFDDRLTPNSRGSYPLSFLSNIKTPPVGKHPKTILFLTADANGILPPVSKLTSDQAMLWFLMGYTSKLAGTETGIVDPVSTFSRFFGEPFMPRNPNEYAKLLGTKMKKHGTEVYLVNTGWSGGPYGIGERMDINLTRR